ncbi:MAG: hypothetical protein GF334_06465 [Candidatus Altiarchaeales archaeon]|nr:hypothetical protein [Candidatus Altiarchaeales archaeon]
MSRDLRNPFYRRLRSKRQERATARDTGGRVQPGSGSVPVKGLREDTKSRHTLVQCKLTERKSFSIKEDEYRLTTERALEMGKMPCWRVQFKKADVAVIRWDDYVQLLEDAGMI